MKYLIVQEWENTKDNHAGMKHMCDLLVEHYPENYKEIVKSAPEQMHRRSNRIFAKLFYSFDRKKYISQIREQYRQDYLRICKPMFENLKTDDEVFLLEYNLDEAPQYDLAVYIKNNFPNVKIYALSHLTPSNIKIKNIEKNILEWDKVIDKELTLGTSLSSYFEYLGIPRSKISTGFHYVDLDYYHPQNTIQKKDRLTVIALGNMQRDYSLLSSVVKNCPNVNWIICGGVRDLTGVFPQGDNVVIKGFMSEEELRYQMEISDVSINVMTDTVGSNVITTSLSMGLGLIVTDVGSIRDYCTEENALFCDNSVESICAAVRKLVDSPELVERMKSNSLAVSKRLSISGINAWFDSL